MTTKLSLAAITAALCASAVLSSNAMAHNAMAQVACGDTITRHAQLTADIIACGSNPALTVVGPAHLDLNGFEVTCSDNMVDVGIMLDGKRARLNDGEVTGCATGVLAAGKGKHHISGVKASANVIGFIAESSRNHFKRNQSVDNTQHGFSDHGGNTYFNNTADRNRRNGFDGKDGSHYVKNSASFNKENGFDVENNNNLTKNTADNNGFNGITTDDNNHITKNTVFMNGERGLFSGLDGHDSNVITRNHTFDNDIGISIRPPTDYVGDCTNNKVHANVATNNHQIGINVEELCTQDNKLTGNTATGNMGNCADPNVRACDLLDNNPSMDCGTNRWKGNVFDDAFPAACVH